SLTCSQRLGFPGHFTGTGLCLLESIVVEGH
ncbi:DNA-binding protein,hypothetical protein, partial [Burkholderia pseudomallei]